MRWQQMFATCATALTMARYTAKTLASCDVVIRATAMNVREGAGVGLNRDDTLSVGLFVI